MVWHTLSTAADAAEVMVIYVPFPQFLHDNFSFNEFVSVLFSIQIPVTLQSSLTINENIKAKNFIFVAQQQSQVNTERYTSFMNQLDDDYKYNSIIHAVHHAIIPGQ